MVVIFLLIDVFDNAGTLIGVAHRAGLLDRGPGHTSPQLEAGADRRLDRHRRGLADRHLDDDRLYRKHLGRAAGGRTGLTAAVVAMLFLLALFFAPLAGMIPAYASAAALLYVACLMTRGLADIDWEDATEFAPAVVAAVTMPLTYSIATGIGLGFITFVACKLAAGRFREVNLAAVLLALVFVVKFAVP